MAAKVLLFCVVLAGIALSSSGGSVSYGPPRGSYCSTRCPSGQVKNRATCRCVRPPRSNYPRPQRNCPNIYCPCSAYRRDSSGCQSCGCSTSSCPMTSCPIYCPYGTEYIQGRNGCSSCQCKSRPTCTTVMCLMVGTNCPGGFVRDHNGCETCVCKPVTCGPVCRNICPGGRTYDSYGCPTCLCSNTGGTNPLIPLLWLSQIKKG